MGKLTKIPRLVLCGFLLFAVAPATAQPPAPAPAKKPAEPVGPPPDPSRYAGENLEEYVAKYSAAFGIASRTTDPFGQIQDPDAKPVAQQSSLLPSATAVPAVPFSEIVQLIQITTIMAAEKRFLVGSRGFGEGDRFPVTYNGQPIWVSVTEVSARQVAFKNLQTGEVAAQKMNTLPPGMTPGTGGITAPGMTPASPQAPLDLDSSGKSSTTPSR